MKKIINQIEARRRILNNLSQENTVLVLVLRHSLLDSDYNKIISSGADQVIALDPILSDTL